MTFSKTFLSNFCTVVSFLDSAAIERCAVLLRELRAHHGRLFILGVGGSAANASHAVNDFRKIAGIEAYTPTDNIAELTARTNDDGWETTFSEWLTVSNLQPTDLILVLSVGGGSKKASPNIVNAVAYAWTIKTPIIGVVGRTGGYTAERATECIMVSTIDDRHITAYAESVQTIIWHLLVMHPLLNQAEMKEYEPFHR